MSPYE
jgi:hypothetical protein